MTKAKAIETRLLADGRKVILKPRASWADGRVAAWLHSLRSPGLPRCFGIAPASDPLDGHLADLPQVPLDHPPAEAHLVFEFIEGVSLRQMAGEELTAPNLEPWFDQLLDALAWMQFGARQAFVHHDISPENILITGDRRAVLIDFSDSRFLDGQGRGPARAPVATAGYAAPEVYFGQVCPETDLFSLARTFIAVLAGQKATDLDRAAIRRALKKLDAPFSNRLRACLEEDPKLRLASVADSFYAEVLGLIRSSDQGVAEDRPVEEEGRPAPRHGCPYPFDACPFLELAYVLSEQREGIEDLGRKGGRVLQ